MDTKILHSRSGRLMALAGFAFAGLGIVALAADSLELVLGKSWIYVFLGYSTWLLFWNPSVRVSSDGVLVDNIFRSTFINWSAIKRIDTKYSLSLETNVGSIRAFAAPAPSRYAGFMANRTESQHLPESTFIGSGLIRPGDLTSSDSGVAAFIIRSHWEKLRDRGELNQTPTVDSRWIRSRLVVFLALEIAAVVGFIS